MYIRDHGYQVELFNRYSEITVVPIDGPIGAEVICGDLLSLSPSALSEIRRAWLDHLVLLFRDRILTDDDLLKVGQYFGQLEKAPSTAMEQKAQRQNPFIGVISNVIENGVAIGGLGNDEAIWHTDMSHNPAPPAASILTSWEIPTSGGGETGFINMYEALETLPAHLKAEIRGKSIYHDGSLNSAGVRRRNVTSSMHPIIRTHPDTKRDSLYLGRRRDAYVEGISRDESDALLDALWKHTTSLLSWHHEWRVGDTLIWDNRCTIHHRNPFSAEARRIMHRTQTAGTPPTFDVDAPHVVHPRASLVSKQVPA